MNPFWIETDNHLRLAIVLRPRGGDWLGDEIALIKKAGVDVLISMLEADEAAELGLSEEATVCKTAGITFRPFPIPDRETPQSTAKFAEFVQVLRGELHAGRSIAVHCRASMVVRRCFWRPYSVRRDSNRRMPLNGYPKREV